MQSWLIYGFGSGLAFFAGVGLIEAGLAASFACGPIWSRVSPVAIAVGTIVAAASATPLPIWFYGLAIPLSIAWLAVVPVGPRISRCAKNSCRAALALVWLAGAAAELPYHLSPTIPPIGEGRLYLFGDSLSAGLTDDSSDHWPQRFARAYDLELVSFARRGAKVATALELADQAALGDGLVLLEIGGNDLLGTTRAADFGRDLEQLLARVAAPGRRLIMFELPLPPLRNEFGRIQRTLAARYDVVLIPKRVLIGVITSPGATVDGLHLSPSGHRQLAGAVGQIVGPALGSQPVDR